MVGLATLQRYPACNCTADRATCSVTDRAPKAVWTLSCRPGVTPPRLSHSRFNVSKETNAILSPGSVSNLTIRN